MMKKICPVCDLPVNELNYCPRCRRIVRKPAFWKTDYHLNEKSQNFHKLDMQKNQNKDHVQDQLPPPPHPGETKNRKKFSFPAVIVMALILVANIVPKSKEVMNWLRDEQSDYEVTVPYNDSGFAELDEEDVKAAGEACTAYEHFPFDGKQIKTAMRQYFKETDHGYQMKDEAVFSDNCIFQEDGEPVSYYETVETLTFDDEITSQMGPNDENYRYQYVDFNYDTATGELHDYISDLKDGGKSLLFLEEFLNLAEKTAGIPKEESSIPSIMEQVRTKEAKEKGTFVTEGIFDVKLYDVEDGVRICVTHHNPSAMASQET